MRSMFIILITAMMISSCANRVNRGQTDSSKSVAAQTPSVPKKSEVFLLGGLHEAHKSHPYYSVSRLEEIVDGVSPDILLIEYPLEWFQNGKPIPERLASLEDKNSGEGAVAWAYCKRTNAKCLAYDIEGRNKYYMKVNYFEREEIFLNAAVSELERLQPVVFEGWARLFSLKMHCNDVTAEIANSRVCDEISKNALEYLFSVLEQYLPDLEVSDKEFAALFKETWERRNRAMAKNICNTAKEHPGDRILVTMGREHRYILKAMLEESCQFIELIEFWEIQ